MHVQIKIKFYESVNIHIGKSKDYAHIQYEEAMLVESDVVEF